MSIKTCVLGSIVILLLVGSDARRPPWRRISRRGQRFDHSFAQAINDFGITLYNELAQDTDNLILAPVGVVTTMSMVMLGARGETEQNLFQGLRLQPLRRTRKVNRAFKRYRKSINAFQGNVTFDMANALYVRPDTTVQRKFTKHVKKFYDGITRRFDLTNQADPEAPINEWIETKTRGMIRNFLAPGNINSDTFMLVLNAIYFKGTWQRIFDESMTRRRSFHVSPTQEVQVNMMTNDAWYATKTDSSLGVQVLEMPYQGNRFAFYIILPDDFGLTQLESRLNHSSLEGLLTNLNSPSRLEISIPKLKLTSSIDLKDVLKDMGITNVFQRGVADLSGMNRQLNLYVDAVKQKAVMEVDEMGTVAAAVTGVRVMVESLPPSFMVDRPFLFVLRDKTAHVNLFIGRVKNPATANEE